MIYTLSILANGHVVGSSILLHLKPHAWTHACTTVDLDTGKVIVVVNGVVTHDMNISNNVFRDNVPIVFENNLLLGAYQSKYKGSPDVIGQSEGSATNVNIFSVPSNITELIFLTSRSRCTSGDVLSWTDSSWVFKGNVETLTKDDFCDPPNFLHLFLMAKTFDNFQDCVNLCPRLQAYGRVPQTSNVTESVLLANQFKDMAYDYKYDHFIWAPFVFRSMESFIDSYKNLLLSHLICGSQVSRMVGKHKNAQAGTELVSLGTFLISHVLIPLRPVNGCASLQNLQF